MLISVISVTAVIISIVISLLFLFRKHHGPANVAFSIALVAMASVIAFDLFSFLNPGELFRWKGFVLIGEAIMVPALLLFSISFARAHYWTSINKISRFMVVISPLVMLFVAAVSLDDFFYSPEFEIEKILFLDHIGYTFYLILLFYSIMSILNTEVTLRSSSGIDRWNIKFVIIGAGAVIGINIFYYSHALLYRSINMNLLPFRSGAVLVSLLVIGYSLVRHKVLDAEVAVSRNIAYRSLSLFVIGGYLLGLGVMGEGLRYFGPYVDRNITIFIAFVGALMVVTVLLSEQLRRKAMVFIDKNFYRHKYDYRDQWLKFTRQISFIHTFDDLLEAIAGGFEDAIGSRGASVWLKEGNNGEFICKRASDYAKPHVKPSGDLTDFLTDSRWILSVSDDKCRDVVTANRDFIEKNSVSLIVPMFQLDELIGFIVLQDCLAGNEYNYEDFDLLKALASQAAAAILNERLANELIEAKEMEAMGKLSSFIMHDLKNAASMLSMITQNAAEHMDNPEFQRDAIKAVSNTSEKMKRIIEKLKSLHHKTGLNIECSDLGAVVSRLVNEHSMNGRAELYFQHADNIEAEFDREEITKVIDNLIINAIDSVSDNGKIEISIGYDQEMAFVAVSDNGCGMSEGYINKHLFKPFRTTKKKGLGIGLFQCRTIAEAHGGTIKVESEEEKGSTFTLYIPLCV